LLAAGDKSGGQAAEPASTVPGSHKAKCGCAGLSRPKAGFVEAVLGTAPPTRPVPTRPAHSGGTRDVRSGGANAESASPVCGRAGTILKATGSCEGASSAVAPAPSAERARLPGRMKKRTTSADVE